MLKITGLNPLYTHHPKIFWALFDAEHPSVELLMREFPALTQKEAEDFFAMWQPAPPLTQTKPKSKQPKPKKSGDSK